MGYMGLENIVCSDMASDLAFTVFEGVAKELAKGLKEKANKYNTPGCVNVALFVEEYLNFDKYWDDDMLDVMEKSKKGLQKLIEKCEEQLDLSHDKNVKYHMKAYKRLVKCLDKFLVQS